MSISMFAKLPIVFFTALLLFTACGSDPKDNGGVPDPDQPGTVASDVDLFITTANGSRKFFHDSLAFNSKPNMSPYTITLNPAESYQVMEGFGAAITGSTCYNLLKMSAGDRARLLKETFDPVSGMGYSYIRISMGCSDFSLSEFTHCDTKGIENFALHTEDKTYVIPVLKEILAIRPDIRIMASPWTCPKWMKVNNLTEKKPFDSWTSGQLNPAYYQDYATYFVKYIEAMKSEGINITSVTIQNEPLNRYNSASLYMTWQEQRDFIKTALGPAFRSSGIQSKIIVYDHNYNYDADRAENKDQIDYPLHIYSDPEAAQYIDGAAYHAYGGDKSELADVHARNTSKNLYFTEISIGSWGYSFADDLMWNMNEVCLGTINNWAKAVIVWNFMLDANHGPNRPGGCTTCYGAIDIQSDYKTMTRNSHYYTIVHLVNLQSCRKEIVTIIGFLSYIFG
jgi:glucosylceramidase